MKRLQMLTLLLLCACSQNSYAFWGRLAESTSAKSATRSAAESAEEEEHTATPRRTGGQRFGGVVDTGGAPVVPTLAGANTGGALTEFRFRPGRY